MYDFAEITGELNDQSLDIVTGGVGGKGSFSTTEKEVCVTDKKGNKTCTKVTSTKASAEVRL